MKIRSFVSTSLIPPLTLGTFALSSALSPPAFARVPQGIQPKSTVIPVAKTQKGGGYIRELRGKDGSLVALQTVIRRFIPLRGSGPSISLVAAVHVGEKSYYKQIQQFLDKQDMVLFEGVRPSRTSAKIHSLQAIEPNTSRVAKPPLSVKPTVGIQKKLSDALNLQFQLEGIHYDRPQFRNSDLDWDAMNALASKAGPDTQKSLASLGNSVAGGSALTWGDQAIDAVLTLSTSTPLLATVLRRLLITALGNSENREALMARTQAKNGAPSAAKKLDFIIVNERNKAVLADIRTLLKTSKRTSPRPLHSIAIFYGAGHMKDMEQHLVSDLGYRTADTQWLTAVQAAH